MDRSRSPRRNPGAAGKPESNRQWTMQRITGRGAGPDRAGEPDGCWWGEGGEGGEPVSAGGYPWISRERDALHQHHPRHATPPPPPPKAPRSQIHVQIGRWGNVLAVRLPQALSRLLHLQQGDAFQLQLLSSGELLLTPRTPRSRIALADHLQRLHEQAGRRTP